MNRIQIILILSLLSIKNLHAIGIRAGAAKIVITPTFPMWLNGYSGRENPATGKIHDLWAKALVIEQNSHNKIIFVTTDLLGLSQEIVEEVFKQITKTYGIQRSQIIFNASHTHSAPVIWPCADVILDFNMAEQQSVSEYSHILTSNIVKVIGMAMSDLSAAKMFNGHDSTGFAINRRNLRDHNNNGSVDHDVPVVKITTPDGKIRAVLFGYACHNTTLVDNNTLFNGDYAGFAQIDIEKNNPGAVALFLMGCGADQNPEPRGTVELATKYGKALAEAVQKVLSSVMKPVSGAISTYYQSATLQFERFDLAKYQDDIVHGNKFLHRRAKLMLEAYNKGWDVSKFDYPIQAVRFGNDLTILALSNEVVVDYSLKAKKLYAKENLYVAGYCNKVSCYIPSKRVLKEGGYEADESMIYYGLPGPFADDVEDRIFTGIKKVMVGVGIKTPVKKK